MTMCKSCSSLESKRYGEENRVRRTLYRHGMTVGQYDEILSVQGGGCAICGTTDPGGQNGRFCVDHDHSTGRIRGLLCNMCNWGLGQFRDDVELMTSAIRYLEGTRGA